jgi:hypothetical protein
MRCMAGIKYWLRVRETYTYPIPIGMINEDKCADQGV